jgi:hypothetical protein
VNEAKPSDKKSNRRRIGSIVFLVLGLGVAFYLGQTGPQEQHIHVILGSAAPDVTAVQLQYAAMNGDIANETRFAYEPGQAPRVVSHDPKLPRGDYDLKVDIGARGIDGGRSVQRRVTLQGGSTQLDLSRE